MAVMRRKPRQQDDAMRLLVRLGHMNRDGHIRGEPRILYTKDLMVEEVKQLGWTWSPELGWIKEYRVDG